MISSRVGTLAAVVLVGVPAIAGCAANDRDSGAATDGVGSPEVESKAHSHEHGEESLPHAARRVLQVLSTSSSDYLPVEEVEDLSPGSSLVIAGTIEEVVDGRIDSPAESEGGFVLKSVGLGIVPDQTAKATGPVPDVVWLELTRGDMPIAAFADTFEAGTPITAYLDRAPVANYSSQGSGYPTGAQVWEPVSPQGLVIGIGNQTEEESSEGVVLPGTAEFVPDDSVEDYLPTPDQ